MSPAGATFHYTLLCFLSPSSSKRKKVPRLTERNFPHIGEPDPHPFQPRHHLGETSRMCPYTKANLLLLLGNCSLRAPSGLPEPVESSAMLTVFQVGPNQGPGYKVLASRGRLGKSEGGRERQRGSQEDPVCPIKCLSPVHSHDCMK